MSKGEIDWLICRPYDGPEEGRPLGMESVSGITIFDLIKEVKKTDEGKVYDVILDEDRIKEISGPDDSGILIVDAKGHRQTRRQFYDSHAQSDGLKFLAIITLIQRKYGV